MVHGRTIILQAAAKAQRGTLTGLAYAGGEMSIAGWGPVIIDLKGLSFKASTPLLENHGDLLENIVGYCQASIRSNQLFISGQIVNSTDAGKRVQALSDDGIPLELSVGVKPLTWRLVKPGTKITVNGRQITAGENGFMLVETSELKEISVVAIGADVNTSIKIAAKSAPTIFKDKNMLTVEQLSEIRAAKSGLSGDSIEAAEAQVLTGAISIPEFKGQMLEAHQSKSKLEAMRGNTPVVTGIVGQNNSGVDDRMLATVATLMYIGGGQTAENMVQSKKISEQTFDAAKRMTANGPHAFVKVLCRLKGSDAANLDGTELMRAAFSTNALPLSIVDASNVIVQDTYHQLSPGWLSFVNQMSLGNFLPNPVMDPNFGGKYSEIGKGGEVKHAVVDSNFDSEIRLKTYSEQLGITRQDMISQPQIYAPIVRAFSMKCLSTQSQLIYAAILGNAGSFFSAGNGNYVDGAPTALGDASLAVAVKMLRLTTDKGKNLLGYEPSVLLVPASLERTARVLINSGFTQRTSDMASTGAWLPKNIELVVAGELETASVHANYSAAAWYLLANKLFSAVVIATLNGALAPIIEQWSPSDTPNTLGFTFRGYTDFACILNNPAAAVMSKGSV